jgi:hypothetical protein
MTSSIDRAHIYTYYTLLKPMVYTMASWIAAHIYTLHCYTGQADGTHDDEFDSCAYIHTTLCSCPWYTQ